MADFPSTSALPQPGEHLEYRPISAWAITGLVLGILFTVLVVGSFIFSLYEGSPLFLPGWIVILAMVGAGISFVAQREIRSAEGTRAGLGLARTGLWLSVFSGLGYFAFSYFTALALALQANSFLMVKDEDNKEAIPDAGFFPRLLAGAKDRAELNRAFLLTLPAANRNGNPNNDQEMMTLYDVGVNDSRGRITQFREHRLVKGLLNTDPDKVKIEPLGIQKWDFENNSYKVIRNYRITTPEAILEVTVPVESTEPGDDDEQRKWFVALPRVDIKTHLTEMGKNLQIMQATLYLILEKWSREALGKEPVKDNTSWEKILPVAAHRNHIRKVVENDIYQGNPPKIAIYPPNRVEALSWKDVDGKLQVNYPVQTTVPPYFQIPAYNLEGTVTLESIQPTNLQQPSNPSWQILHVQWHRALLVDPPGIIRPKGK